MGLSTRLTCYSSDFLTRVEFKKIPTSIQSFNTTFKVKNNKIFVDMKVANFILNIPLCYVELYRFK